MCYLLGIATVLSSSSMFILAIENISLNVHMIGMIAYGVGRMMVFGMFFTNIGKRFGFSKYGTLAGLGLILSAIVSLIQYPLITFAAENKEKTVNIICGVVMLLIGLPYSVWLGLREMRERHKIKYTDSLNRDHLKEADEQI